MSAQPLDARLAHLEGAFVQVDRRLDSLERRLESFERATDSRFNQIDSRFNWLIGIVVTSWISTIVTVLFHR
jgi:tetrahydromethanopterin S-methyltransferase subunit G